MSVDARPPPSWYDDAKLGLFVHWGLYSVPAWAPPGPDIQTLLRDAGPTEMLARIPYAEWYRNTMGIAGSATAVHHREVWGAGFAYDDFIPAFDAATATADLDAIAQVAVTAGAGYVVLTTKHADGFALWPSRTPHPRKGAYRSARDLVGGLTDAVRARGLRMGLYYCGGYDWAYTDTTMRHGADLLLAIPTTAEYERFAATQVRELIAAYAPDVLWGDVAWPVGDELDALVATYRAAVPDGVVNDRWAVVPGLDAGWRRALLRGGGWVAEHLWSRLPAARRRLDFPHAPFADFTTPEYAVPDAVVAEKWEATRGVGHSFGANHAEPASDLVGGPDLVRLLVDVVAKGGNLLVGVGPGADGTVPAAQVAPLRALGGWLEANEPAIRGSRPWTCAVGTCADGSPWRATVTGGVVHALLLEPPVAGEVVLRGLGGAGIDAVVHLGSGASLPSRAVDGDLAIDLPAGRVSEPVVALRLLGDPRPI